MLCPLLFALWQTTSKLRRPIIDIIVKVPPLSSERVNFKLKKVHPYLVTFDDMVFFMATLLIGSITNGCSISKSANINDGWEGSGPRLFIRIEAPTSLDPFLLSQLCKRMIARGLSDDEAFQQMAQSSSLL